MNRLRVRVELNRRKAGVPLDEMVSVVEETRKFFHLLAEDVEIEPGRGEWLASDFDPESLNFTAEYAGPASAEQIRDFSAAFSGSTSLRQETISQFTHIAELIGEDELVGFGLYQSDQETEPSDWRCLSRRDAQRFSNEIQFLARAVGESVSPLPGVINGSAGGRRLFKDRRERETLATDPFRRIREVESNLSRRVALLEGKVGVHAEKIQDLGASSEASDERFRHLITAMESAWSQAPRQLAAPEGTVQSFHMPAGSGRGSQATAPNSQRSEPVPALAGSSKHRLVLGLLLAVAAVSLAGLASSEGRAQLRRVSISLGLPVHKDPTASLNSEATSVLSANPLSNPDRRAAVAPNGETAVPVPADPSQRTPLGPVPLVAPSPKSSPPRPVAGSQAIRQIALQIPSDLKAMVESEALVYVTVAIDEKGNVTDARVTLTKGEGADLLVPEALKAARWFRFSPAREGKKLVRSHAALTFVFEPESSTVLHPPGN
jgi:TonB family protein